MNTAYCTIDEAWGDLVGKDVKKRRKKPPSDPICELYDAKVNSSYNDTDLVRYANEFHDKSKYQRSMRLPESAYEEEERQPKPKPTILKENVKTYDSAQPDSALFEKQFDIKLPPLYDGEDCPITQENEQMWVEDEYEVPRPKYKPRTESFHQDRFIFPEEERSHRYDYDHDNVRKRYGNLQIFDIILYVISGIILIFLMDQFVKIGMNLQS